MIYLIILLSLPNYSTLNKEQNTNSKDAFESKMMVNLALWRSEMD